jgi:hypothetical protein
MLLVSANGDKEASSHLAECFWYVHRRDLSHENCRFAISNLKKMKK